MAFAEKLVSSAREKKLPNSQPTEAVAKAGSGSSAYAEMAVLDMGQGMQQGASNEADERRSRCPHDTHHVIEGIDSGAPHHLEGGRPCGRPVDGLVGNHLARLGDNLLPGSRLEGVITRDGQVDVDVRHLAIDAVELVGPAAHARSLIDGSVRVEVKGLDVPVYADAKWIGFVLGQLIENAVKYRSPAPRLLFSAQVRNRGCASECVDLAVEDNGLGVPAEDLPRVFDKGFVGQNGRLEGQKKSTGLGLYLVKRLCDKMGVGVCMVFVVSPAGISLAAVGFALILIVSSFGAVRELGRTNLVDLMPGLTPGVLRSTPRLPLRHSSRLLRRTAPMLPRPFSPTRPTSPRSPSGSSAATGGRMTSASVASTTSSPPATT